MKSEPYKEPIVRGRELPPVMVSVPDGIAHKTVGGPQRLGRNPIEAALARENDRLRKALEAVMAEVRWLDTIDPHGICVSDYDGSVSIIRAHAETALTEKDDK